MGVHDGVLKVDSPLPYFTDELLAVLPPAVRIIYTHTRAPSRR